MFTLRLEFSKQISAFAPLFSKKVFEHAKVLVTGCVLVYDQYPEVARALRDRLEEMIGKDVPLKE